jgi:hypothetical protein
MAVGFILAAGCVATTNKNTGNSSSNTSDTRLNTTATSTSTLKGSLSVSVTGFSSRENLSVVLDNKTAGTVNRITPLNLMVSEGDHTVMVCADSVCVHKNVTTRFGKYVTVDFSEQLQREVANAQPTVRIIACNRNGNTLSVDVEFINPSTKDCQMSVTVRSGYSYIDGRTSLKMGDSTRGIITQTVKAGQRLTERLDLHFANGNSINYDYPVLELKVT